MATPGNLASTFFNSGSADQVMVVNPEDVTGNVPINGYISKVKDGSKSVANFLGSNKGMLSDIVALGKDASANQYTKGDLLERVGGVLGKVGTGAYGGGLSETIQSVITNTLPVSMDTIQEVMVTAKNAESNAEQLKDITGFRSIMDTLGEYVGPHLVEIFDIDAEVAFLTGIAKDLGEIGFPNILDIIDDRLSKEDSGKLKNKVYTNLWPQYIDGSNMDQLKRILAEVGPSPLLGYYPDTIKRLLSRYRRGNSIVPSDALEELLGVLNDLDVNWGKVRRSYVPVASESPVGDKDHEWIFDLNVWSSISKDAYDLFILDDDYIDVATIAKDYGERSIKDIVTRMYPGFVFTDLE